jgi:hypothetical protein
MEGWSATQEAITRGCSMVEATQAEGSAMKAQEMLDLAAECKRAAAELHYMGSVPQLLVRCELALRLAAQTDAPGAPSDRQFNADLRDDELPQSPQDLVSELADVAESHFLPIVNAAQFLLDRLEEFDPGEDDAEREYHGHVTPAIAHLRTAITRPDRERQT